MTIWCAYQAYEEADKGSIEVGKRADFVILSDDPTAVDPETLDQLLVTETIKDDASIFVRGEKKAELLRGRDVLRPGLDEMFRQLHVMRQTELLPAQYQTDAARQHFASTFDDCGTTLLLPWLFRLPEPGQAMAAN
jgi:hypothetical protein